MMIVYIVMMVIMIKINSRLEAAIQKRKQDEQEKHLKTFHQNP